MADKQVILGVLMILVSHPIKSLSYTYFNGLDPSLAYLSTMLYVSFLVLGSTLVVFAFIRYRVAKIRRLRGE